MIADSPTAEVSNNAGQSRFELRLNGDLVGILGYYELDTNAGAGVRVGRRSGPPVVSFMHTVIVEDFGHRGLAAVMVQRALDAAREYGWKVRPVCTYLQRFIADNPQYQDMLAPL
ncbi:GNAT family N-acetyltransferase [Rhodococcus sp. NPDC127528]|uniref:GNAT family N-acetyltransferase n=1 Tax=unclassified Rhodococcus (in: high G+C Gram-positive bacteria) TaxID=192944 RepID=UPI0036414A60